VRSGNPPEDDNGHGTHVAGSILGSGAASSGGLLKGGANLAKLVPSSIWSPALGGILFGSDQNTMLTAMYNEGVRVHSNSWGAASNAYDAMAVDMDTFMWKNPEFLLVFAAGNGGVDANKDGVIDQGSLGSPGTAKNVLTVGASENYLLEGGQLKTHFEWHPESWPVEPIASDKVSNNSDGLAAFSSRGPTSDGRTKPEIVSPGTNIVSARSHRPKAGLLWGEYDAEHLYCGGTSMATPLTSGAAAVTREFLIKGRGIATPSAALVKATLLHTAHDLYPGQYGLGATQEIPVRRPNVQEGYGRVDMDAATALGLETLVIDNKTGVATGEQVEQSVEVPSGGSLVATISYTDAPGAASAAIALVNDLDIEVVTPVGAIHALKDRRNNSEMLELSALKGGTYVVRVKGHNVPQGMSGRQPFALLVTAK
jgi:subtilisin family serine protease